MSTCPHNKINSFNAHFVLNCVIEFVLKETTKYIMLNKNRHGLITNF